MKADPRTETEVMSVLQGFVKTYAKRDLPALLAHFASDPDVAVIGSSADERRVGLAEIQAHFEREWAQWPESSLEIGWNQVSSAAGVVWITAELSFHAQADNQCLNLTGRLTAILERRHEKWLIAHLHFSVPS